MTYVRTKYTRASTQLGSEIPQRYVPWPSCPAAHTYLAQLLILSPAAFTYIAQLHIPCLLTLERPLQPRAPVQPAPKKTRLRPRHQPVATRIRSLQALVRVGRRPGSLSESATRQLSESATRQLSESAASASVRRAVGMPRLREPACACMRVRAWPKDIQTHVSHVSLL